MARAGWGVKAGLGKRGGFAASGNGMDALLDLASSGAPADLPLLEPGASR